MNASGFIRWCKEWLAERRKYPSLLEVGAHEPAREEGRVSVVARPWLERREELPHLLEPRYPGDCYETPVCLFHELLTKRSAECLNTAIGNIRKFQPIDFLEGIAYLTQLFLLAFDFERSLREYPSILFGPTCDELASTPDPKLAVHEWAERPVATVEALLDFWMRVGAIKPEGFLKRPSDQPGRFWYFTIPPVWLSLEDLREIAGVEGVRAEIPARLEIAYAWLADRLLKIDATVEGIAGVVKAVVTEPGRSGPPPIAREKVLVVDERDKSVYCLGEQLPAREDHYVYILCWAEKPGLWVRNDEVRKRLNDPTGGRTPSKVKFEIREMFGDAYHEFKKKTDAGTRRCDVEDEWGSSRKFTESTLPSGLRHRGCYQLNLRADQVSIITR